MHRIMEYIFNMLPYMLLALPVTVLVRVAFINVRKYQHITTTAWHEVGLCLFVLFLVGLASQTVIPKIEFGMNGISVRDAGLRGEINLIPFKVFADTWNVCVVQGNWLYFIVNFVGNILLFVPIGFAIPLLWHDVSFRKTAVIALCGSALIEVCQLPQARGTDIDDLWLNMLGAMLGFGIYALLQRHDVKF